MKLHVFPPSPNARKVLIAANELGLTPELCMVDLSKGEQMKPEFLQLNPNHLMPVLEDGDFVLWESNAIMQYLTSKKPGSGLWPSDARSQADVSRWQFWQTAHWGPACGIFTFENLVKGLLGMGEPDAKELAKGEENLKRFATVLEEHLKGRQYLAGNAMTLADISVGVWLTYQKPARFPLAAFTEIQRWYANLEAKDSWKKTAPPPMP